jgi:hypothetical protein
MQGPFRRLPTVLSLVAVAALGVWVGVYSSDRGVGGAQLASFTGSTYHPLSPYRVLDTRSGSCFAGSNSNTCIPLGPGGTRDFQVTGTTGQGGTGSPVPSDATGVVLNVTGISPTSGTFLTLYPTGHSPGTPPPISNVNPSAGDNIGNLVTVPVGDGGMDTVYNSLGNIDVAVDLFGYFATASTSPGHKAGEFHPLPPTRVCDTRAGAGFQCSGTSSDNPLAPGGTLKVNLLSSSTHAAAAVFNLTAVNGTSGTFLTAYEPSGGSCLTPPTVSNLNVPASTNRANRVMVPIDSSGDVCIYNSLGNVNIVVDLNGWYGTGGESSPGGFYVFDPERICVTRPSAPVNQCSAEGPLTAGGVLPVMVAGVDDVPAVTSSSPPVAVVVNVTAISGTKGTFLTVFPGGTSLPLASDINPPAFTNLPNLVAVALGASGDINIYNDLGTIDVAVDTQGYFAECISGYNGYGYTGYAGCSH